MAGWDVMTWFSDPDAGDSLTFEVSGLPDGGWLTWDEATNRLAIAAGATDDAEVGVYTLTVTASDTTSPTALMAVHTVALDRRERPRVPGCGDEPFGTSDDAPGGEGGRGGRLGCLGMVHRRRHGYSFES